MELSKKAWKVMKKECLNENFAMDHHSNAVCGRFIGRDVNFEFSHPYKYYTFKKNIVYWFHRYNDAIGFCSNFIVQYSPEFLIYFPDVQPPNDSIIKYEKKAKHNILLSFKSPDDFSLSKKEIPYFFKLIRPTIKDDDVEDEAKMLKDDDGTKKMNDPDDEE
jgi:hypothetical protein